ncbi:MAG: ATP-binding cassette domain-containing protein [Pseudomonadota bacterium]
MIRIDQLTFERGEQRLFDQCSLRINPSQSVGLVGRNGAGKSTLFALLLGEAEASSGSVTLPEHWRVQHMAQEVDASDRRAIDFVIDGDERLRELEAALVAADADNDAEAMGSLHAALADHDAYTAEARAGTILHGLGFRSEDFDKPQRSFSGGWRIRLSLAQALMCPADLLLLDEPTNHLDLEATIWLEEHLRRYPGTLLIIAHDREFLDAVTDHTLHLSQHKLTLYSGNYSAFEAQRIAALEQNAAQFAKQQREVAHLDQFIRRFRAKATKAKQVQSRIKALERMDRVVLMQQESPYRIEFPNADQFSNPLLTLDGLALGYAQHRVLNNVKASVLPGDRLGVLGENGAGKSTLLKAVVGDLAPQDGDIVRGRHAHIGYFAQHQLETLDRRDTPLISFQQQHQMSEQKARDTLGCWGFSKTLCERRIEKLSGGEKARLVLALIAQDRPGILVLDEPTNHLDLDMREALALALQSYDGALLLVSHDRTLLERCVDAYWLVADGHLHTRTNGLDAYTRDVRKQRLGSSEPKASVQSDGGSNAAQRRRQAAAARKALKPLRDKQKKLEQELDRLQKSLKAVESRLADPDVYHSLPADELDALLKEAGKLRQATDAAEHDWLAVSEELESADSG